MHKINFIPDISSFSDARLVIKDLDSSWDKTISNIDSRVSVLEQKQTTIIQGSQSSNTIDPGRPYSRSWLTIPTLQNSWVDDSGSGNNFGNLTNSIYSVDSLGIVRCLGQLQGGTVTPGTLLWTFPANAAPLSVRALPIPVFTSTTPFYVTAVVIIDIDGTVVLYAPSTATSLGIDAIQFPVNYTNFTAS